MNMLVNHINTHIQTFDANNYNWAPTMEYNRIFIRSVEAWLNQRLAAKGHVFLNEVFDALGYERTRPGVLQGWLFDPNNPRPIDLQITEGENGTLVLTIVTSGNIHDQI